MIDLSRPSRVLGALVATAMVVSACGGSGSTSATGSTVVIGGSAPMSVIVDYSPTVSDVGGLVYLLAHPSVDVVAVTLPGTGEAGCDLGIEVTLGILAMFNEAEIPVACDSEIPSHARMWPPEFLAGQENLTSGLPEPTAAPSGESVPDLIARVTADADHPVVLYAVAPLTNVARALEEHPSLVSELERIVIMGGAVNVPGNVQGTNSEWNVWIDVPAASAVFTSGASITLVPLDATNDVPVPGDHRRVLSEANQTEAIVYLSGLLDLFPSATSDFYFMWDELAASVASGEPTVSMEPLTIAVVVGGDDDGRTVVTDGGHEVEVSTGVDAPDTFYAIFVSVLSAAQE